MVLTDIDNYLSGSAGRLFYCVTELRTIREKIFFLCFHVFEKLFLNSLLERNCNDLLTNCMQIRLLFPLSVSVSSLDCISPTCLGNIFLGNRDAIHEHILFFLQNIISHMQTVVNSLSRENVALVYSRQGKAREGNFTRHWKSSVTGLGSQVRTSVCVSGQILFKAKTNSSPSLSSDPRGNRRELSQSNCYCWRTHCSFQSSGSPK